MKISEETVKIELHTIATYDGKEYELEELMNNMFKINAELHSIIKEVREYIMTELITEWDIKNDGYVSGSDLPVDAITPILEILDKENKYK